MVVGAPLAAASQGPVANSPRPSGAGPSPATLKLHQAIYRALKLVVDAYKEWLDAQK